jgi:protein-tyrosine phosphatase
MTIKVLFVCLGNICRSPTAQGVFTKMVVDKNLKGMIQADSAGTSNWHSGNEPDARAMAAASAKGYDLSDLRARAVVVGDFEKFDFIMAMDRENLAILQTMCPKDYSGELALFLDYAQDVDDDEVPDPYYEEVKGEGFLRVLALVEKASEGLITHILRRHRL